MSTPELGSIVGGKYRLVRPLLAGGMDAVYEAEHCLSLRPAAIKLLSACGDERRTQAILAAARAAAAVHHPNVIEIYDVVRQDDAILLVMEVLLGESLAALLGRDAPTLHELVRLLLPAMHGAAAAHTRAVVHRAITPDCVFLAQVPGYSRAVPKLIDFGLPSAARTHACAPHAPSALQYLAPEQLFDHAVDARADVYAFGVILYESLAGSPPYGAGRTRDEQASFVATRTAIAPRTLRREIPEALDALVMHAIAREPAARLATMAELAERLAPFEQLAPYGAPVRSFAPRTRHDLPRAHVARSLGRTAQPTPARRSLPARGTGGRVALAVALAASLGLLLVAARAGWPATDEPSQSVEPPKPIGADAPEPRPSLPAALPTQPAGALLPSNPHEVRPSRLATNAKIGAARHGAGAGESDGGPTRAARDRAKDESALPDAPSHPRRRP